MSLHPDVQACAVPWRDAAGVAAMAVFDLLPDGVVVVDSRGSITFVNQPLLEMFGYRADRLLGAPVEVLLAPRHRHAHVAARVGSGGSRPTRLMGSGIDLQGCRADGSEFPVDIALNPLPSNDGELVLAVVRDMTERRAVEDELRDVGALLQQASEAFYVFDGETFAFTSVNDGAVRQSGYPRGRLLTMGPSELFDDLDADWLRRLLAPVRCGSRPPVVLALHLAAADGTRLRVEARITRLATARLPARFVAVVHDVGLRDAERAALLAEERERIARNLGGCVVHDLFAAGLALQGLAVRVGTAHRDLVQGVVDRLDGTIGEVRAAISSWSQADAPAVVSERRP